MDTANTRPLSLIEQTRQLELAEVRKLHEQGFTVEQMADATGYKVSRIKLLCEDAGIVPVSAADKRKWTPEQDHAIVNFCEALAEQKGIPPHAVANRAKYLFPSMPRGGK